MRVLVVTQDFPPVTGGIQNFIGNLAAHLHPLVEHLSVVAPCAPGWREHDGTLPFPVHRISIHSSWLVLPLLLRLPALVRSERATHVLFAQWFPAMASVGSSGVRTATLVHGREMLNHPLGRLGLAAAPVVLRRMDAILPNSRATAALLPACIEPSRVRIVHPGVDLVRFVPPLPEAKVRLRRRLEIPDDAPVVSTLARLVPRKGIDTLIRSIVLVRKTCPETRLVVAGSGPDLERLRLVAEQSGASDSVVFAGRMPDEDLTSLLSLGVFALLSRRTAKDVEGFGMVLAEAQACGAPVVAAATGGMPEAVGPGGGAIVPPDDPQAAAKAISRYLLDPPEAAASGRRGRLFAEGLDWPSRAKEVFATLSTITSRK